MVGHSKEKVVYVPNGIDVFLNLLPSAAFNLSKTRTLKICSSWKCSRHRETISNSCQLTFFITWSRSIGLTLARICWRRSREPRQCTGSIKNLRLSQQVWVSKRRTSQEQLKVGANRVWSEPTEDDRKLGILPLQEASSHLHAIQRLRQQALSRRHLAERH